MSRDSDKHVGLVGGSIERRIATSRVPPVDHPFVLAPFRDESDREDLRLFTAGDGLQIEVGFGRSHHLLDLAEASTSTSVLGFEIRRQWVRQAATGAARRGLDNVRVVEGDARPFLEQLIEPGTVACVHILFPDPWWKRRHHKRRVFSEAWLGLLGSVLAPGGSLVAKTDVPAYADQMERTVAEHPSFRLCGTSVDDSLLDHVPRSHREKKCAEANIPVYAFRYTKETT